jgi:hypothetical protein
LGNGATSGGFFDKAMKYVDIIVIVAKIAPTKGKAPALKPYKPPLLLLFWGRYYYC